MVSNHVAVEEGPRRLLSSVVRVDNVCCQLEVKLVHDALRPFTDAAEIKDVQVSVKDRTAYVEHWSTLHASAVVDALNEARLAASLQERGESDDSAGVVRGRELCRAGHVFLQVFLFLLGFFLCGDLKQVQVRVGAATIGQATCAATAYLLCLALSFGLFHKAWVAVSRLRSNVELLMAVAMGGSLLQGRLMEAALVGTLVTLMDFVTFISVSAVDRRLSQAISVLPSMITLQDGATAPLKDLKKDMVFVVRAGDGIPADGFVIQGTGSVDESRVTGEAMPVYKDPDSRVFSGSVLQTGFITVKASADADKSFQVSVSDQVKRAKDTISNTEAIVNRFAVWYTPAVIFTAVFVAVMQRDFQKFLVIVVAGCPCALLGAAPFVQAATLAVLASRHGLLVKASTALESLARMRWLGIDKTGTITTGQFKLLRIRSFGHFTQKQLHEWAAALETRDNHPLAQSIVASYTGCLATFAGWDGLPKVTQFQREGRCGVRGNIDDHIVGVGNSDFLEACGIPLKAEAERLLQEWSEEGTALVVTVDQAVGGMLLLEDSMRSNAPAAVAQLKALGVHPAMLTGDRYAPAKRAADAAGIETVHAGLKPNGKAQLLLKASHCSRGGAERQSSPEPKHSLEEEFLEMDRLGAVQVGFLGDGLNDCLALASAHVGIAMQEVGSRALVDASSAVLQADIGHLPAAIVIARRSRCLVIVNISFALLLNAAVVFAAAVYGLPLWLSVVMDNGTLLLVFANSLWPLCWRVSLAGDARTCEESGGQERFVARGRSASDFGPVGLPDNNFPGEVPHPPGDGHMQETCCKRGAICCV